MKKFLQYSEIIRKCYKEILNRDPDEVGLNHYLNLLEAGTLDEDKLREIMKTSEEYKIKVWRNTNTTKLHPAGNFFIKENYLHRLQPDYFHDVIDESGIVWQPYVYTLADYLGKKFGSTHIIDIGCGSAQKLVKLYPSFEIIGIDYSHNLTKCRNRYGFGKWIECNLEELSDLDISEDTLKKSIIVCSDVIEHLANPSHLLKYIKKILDHSPACLLSTPERDFSRNKMDFGPPLNPHHVREWNIVEFQELLNYYKFNLAFTGLTTSNNMNKEKQTIVMGIENNKSTSEFMNISNWNDMPFLSEFMLCKIKI